MEKDIARFRKLQKRCQTNLTDRECVIIALKGLNFNLREKLEGQDFYDLFLLASRAASYEQLMKEQRRNSSKETYYRNPSLEGAMVEQDLDSESDDEVEVCVAEMINGKPYVCPALSSPKSNASRSSKTKRTWPRLARIILLTSPKLRKYWITY